MNEKKVDKGFELRYKNLSYRRRFIRTLWMLPLAILVLCISYWAGVSIYVLISLAILFLVVDFLQAYNNYKLWKKQKAKKAITFNQIPIYRIEYPNRPKKICWGQLFVYSVAIMPFWTVGDAGPYKEKPNFFMRTALLRQLFSMK